jgi:glycosyltransferase involved in cell wall biosynthesis
MAVRERIGIPFDYDENWIGGTYYIRNLISSFKLLEESKKPEVIIISHARDSFEYIRNSTNYPLLTWVTPESLNKGVTQSAIRHTSRRFPLIRKFLVAQPWLRQAVMGFLARSAGAPDLFDVLFPNSCDGYEDRTICWIPDFQEKHLPEFFSASDLVGRDRQHRLWFTSFNWIVFSSRSTFDDFERFYPGQKIEPHILHFAVFNEPVALDLAAVKRRLGLPERFFYSPNQFWIHKNHAVVLDALGLLRARGLKPFVAFSGKEFDPRAPGYTEALKLRVIEEGLQEQVAFLGFLPRDEQLAVLADATAVIQPSLSEGWSTVVEDAKSVGQFVIASDLPVHREQLQENCDFFPARDPHALADLMARYIETGPVKRPIDYAACQRAFAEGFLAVATKAARSRNGARAMA